MNCDKKLNGDEAIRTGQTVWVIHDKTALDQPMLTILATNLLTTHEQFW